MTLPYQKQAEDFIKKYWWVFVLVLAFIILYLLARQFLGNPFFP